MTNTNPSTNGKRVLVSAGHTNKAGQDQGVANKSYVEGREAVRVRDTVAAELRDLGCTVIEDGDDGVNDPLTKAIALAKTAGVAVEFHFNAGPPKATGIEVLAKLKDRVLAQKLAVAIATATGITLRGDRGYKPDNSGQHHRLGFCQAGGLIVEVCFLTNSEDMAAYEINLEAMAKGLAGVLASAAK